MIASPALFSPLLVPKEQLWWARAYRQGHLLTLDCTLIEPMGLALPGVTVQAIQHVMSVGTWHVGAILQQYQRLVAKPLGDQASGMLFINGCDFPKHLNSSVRASRQWFRALGKEANSAASLVAAYAGAHSSILVDRRPYLPEP